tara:strand:- start:414 stop:641 length:228 start_codon:yes stop_codon:yes gene_type:complete
MVEVKINDETYICEDEKELIKEFRKEGLSPEIQIREIIKVDPETIKLLVNGSMWALNGYVLSKILDRVPSLFKKE